MENVFKKITNKLLFIICLVAVGCVLMPTLIRLEFGDFIADSIVAGLYVLLAFSFLKGFKDKKFIIILFFLGNIILNGFDSVLNCFSIADSYSGSTARVVYYVICGFTSLATFGACVCQVLPMLFKMMPKKTLNTISMYCYLGAAALAFITFIYSLFLFNITFSSFCSSFFGLGVRYCLYFILICEMFACEANSEKAEIKEPVTEKPVEEVVEEEPAVEEEVSAKEPTSVEEPADVEPAEEQSTEASEECADEEKNTSCRISITDKMDVLEATPIVNDDDSKK